MHRGVDLPANDEGGEGRSQDAFHVIREPTTCWKEVYTAAVSSCIISAGLPRRPVPGAETLFKDLKFKTKARKI